VSPRRDDDGGPRFRVVNEFAAVDVALREVPWGTVLEVTDARTGITVQLDALEVEALTTLDRGERDVLVNRSAGRLRRSNPGLEGP
jgi:hypothetical protein